MIQVKKLNWPAAEHFDPEHNSLGWLNELQSLDLRLQICEANVEGYYMVFDGDIFTINKDGLWENFPMGKLYLTNPATELSLKLIKAQREKKPKDETCKSCGKAFKEYFDMINNIGGYCLDVYRDRHPTNNLPKVWYGGIHKVEKDFFILEFEFEDVFGDLTWGEYMKFPISLLQMRPDEWMPICKELMEKEEWMEDDDDLSDN